MSPTPPKTSIKPTRRAALVALGGATLLSLPLTAFALDVPPVTVATNPIIVYGIVALLVGSVAVGLWFARPRKGLGPRSAAERSAALASQDGGGLPWMPGGDIFGDDDHGQPAPQPARAPGGWPVRAAEPKRPTGSAEPARPAAHERPTQPAPAHERPLQPAPAHERPPQPAPAQPPGTTHGGWPDSPWSTGSRATSRWTSNSGR